MNKKIILTSYIILSLLCACSKDTKKELKASFEMNSSEMDLLSEDVVDREIGEEVHEDLRQPEIEFSDNRTVTSDESNKVTTNVTEFNSNENVEENKESDNSVDTSSIDYSIHKGRIDCTDESSCMEISLPIQYEFKQSIANTYYLEVISKSDNTLGYFIQYIFKDYEYQTEEECNNIGKRIKEILSDRVVSYECNLGNLKINTDYQ